MSEPQSQPLPASPLPGVILIDPDRLSGTPIFVGTRVPVQTLFDYLAGGEPLSEFYADFPGVKPEQVEAVLRAAGAHLLNAREAA
jgi:uncharacterized protein (DUF433 family)